MKHNGDGLGGVDADRLILAGRVQSGLCATLDAPTWVAVIDHQLDELVAGRVSATIESLRADEDDPLTSNVWLRLLGAAHRVALDGADHELPTALPSCGGERNPAEAAERFDDFVARFHDEIAAGMAAPVQTNEVMRATPISAALNWLGGDVNLLEVGASAGLNLWMDRYRVETTSSAWGPADAVLTLRPDVTEGAFSPGSFRVTARRGCDRRPLDPTNGEHRRLLRSFVWPDHVERLRRLELAIDACPAGVVEQGDAVEWARDALAALPIGRTVLFHTIVMPYLSDAARAEFEITVRSAAASADQDHGFAWLRMELSLEAGLDDVDLVVTQWPERTTHRLARLTPHATSIRWHPELIDAPN